jgi:hypothetical protein
LILRKAAAEVVAVRPTEVHVCGRGGGGRVLGAGRCGRDGGRICGRGGGGGGGARGLAALLRQRGCALELSPIYTEKGTEREGGS